MRLIPAFIVVIFLLSSCSSTKHIASGKDEFGRLKLLSEYEVPFNKEFQNTVIGGLSGIDYDSANQVYYIISDDRSERNPARYYKAKIISNDSKIDSVEFIETTLLKNMEGNFYPGPAQDIYHTPDPEAIRFNASNNSLVWSSEGERIVTSDRVVLEDPTITEINDKGIYTDTFVLPPQLPMSALNQGPRRNSVFEGLSFADNYKTLFVNVEEPLYNDGSRAGLNDATGLIRILKFDVTSKKPVAQYGYRIDPVAYPPAPEGAFVFNGAPDILSVNANDLLVIERSFSTGRPGCTIKIYMADLTSAENIQDVNSLVGKNVKLVQKKLLLNMDDLHIYIDNIEGVCFGPTLSNGHRT
ncbi:MAG: esterase-like activity of phytase family protein, partial [Ginsengibacter sp.]